MPAISSRFIPAACCAALLLNSAIALADAPASRPSNAASMQQRIDTLQSKIQTLEQKQKQNQSDVTAAIASVMADADKHSVMLDSGSTAPAGYDPAIGFVLGSADGNFLLHPSALFQFRNVSTYRTEIAPGGGGITHATGYDIDNGFEVSRMRLAFDGNAFTPQFTYYVQFDADQGTPFSLLDAYVMWRVSNQSSLALKAGQFKDPLFHEKNLLPGNQLAVDRSLLDNYIGGGETERVQGGEVVYDENRLRGVLAYHDGFNSGNTGFFDAGGLGAGDGGANGVTPTNWGVSVRAEYLLIGNRTPEFNPFSEYDQFTAMGAKQDILVVGGGAEYSEAGDNKYVPHTVDAQYISANGLSLYGAYEASWRSLSTFQGVRKGFYYDDGFLIQAGYMVTPNIEPFARYDYTYLNGQAVPGLVKDELHEITIGANYYMHGQNVKFTTDLSWLPNGAPTDASNLGYLQNNGHNIWALRAQFQLSL